MMDSVDFKKCYPFQAYGRYAKAVNAVAAHEEGSTQAWIKELREFDKAVLGKLRAMAARGMLAPVEFAAGRGLRWVRAWDRVASGAPPEHGSDKLEERVCSGMGMRTLHHQAGAEPSKAAYLALVERVEAGGLSVDVAGGSTCARTGESIDIELEGWKPRLIKWVAGPGRQRIAKPVESELPELEPQSVSIPLPSGKLLIADWFHLDAFAKRMDFNREEPGEPTIDSVEGRWRLTRRLAQEHGVLSVSVGNSTPKVLFDGSVLAIARLNSDAERSKLASLERGAVCTDLWQATAVDKQTLVDIVAAKAGQEKALSIVDKYLSKNEHVAIDFPAGAVLRASFVDHGMEGFSSPRIDARGIGTLFCAASVDALSWERTAVAPTPKMR